MKSIIIISLLSIFASCASHKPATQATAENVAVKTNRSVASEDRMVNLKDLIIVSAFNRSSLDDARALNNISCNEIGGTLIYESLHDKSQMKQVGFHHALGICEKGKELVSLPEKDPLKNPNEMFCYLRTTERKCTEIGECKWVSGANRYCSPRPGIKDPNASFCYLRSSEAKCSELSGVCQWNSGAGNYCTSRE